MVPEPSGNPLLRLQTYGLCFGSRVVLSQVDLCLPAPGIDILMGPVKAGKSSLVRSLAGLHAANRLARTWGVAELDGRPLAEGHRPALVQQHAAVLGGSLRDALVAPCRGSRERSSRAWTEFAEEALGLYGLGTLAGRLGSGVLDLPAHHQRAVNILGHALAGPWLLMIDEPTFGLGEGEANWLVDWLAALGRRCRLLVVLHHQGQARRLGDRIVLLGGGRVLAHERAGSFFDAPPNAWVEQFVRSGSLSIASPGARAEDLCPEVDPPAPLPPEALRALASFAGEGPSGSGASVAAACAPGASSAPAGDASAFPAAAASPVVPSAPPGPCDEHAAACACSASATPLPVVSAAAPREAPVGVPSAAGLAAAQRRAALPPVSQMGVQDAAQVGRSMLVDHRGPNGFHWVVPGKLAGCPEPGIVHGIDYDLDLLRRVGIRVLVTLTERDIDTQALARHGLRNIHLPIFDREAPSLAQAYMLIRRIQKLMDEGLTVAVHCKAGIGRTGTVLAAWMVREGGLSAASALQLLRNVNRAYVQTPLQEAFLHELEADIVARL